MRLSLDKFQNIIYLLLTHDIAINKTPKAPGTTNKYMLVLSHSIPTANNNGADIYSILVKTRGSLVIATSVTHIEVIDPRKSQKLRTWISIKQYLYSGFLLPSQAW
jgi:hypothetical protein